MRYSYTVIPYYFITEILRRKAKKLAKHHTISLFGYDPGSNTITIFTDHPNYWLHECGSGMNDLTDYINKKIEEHNHLLTLVHKAGNVSIIPKKIEPITIRLEQCDS